MFERGLCSPLSIVTEMLGAVVMHGQDPKSNVRRSG